jgi:hypothetical protein
MSSVLQQLPNGNRKHWHGLITAANTDTQIYKVAWTTPVNAYAILEKMIISNQNTTPAIVLITDQDIVSTGTKPPIRGSAANPIIPPINVAAGAQVILGNDLCPNPDFHAGVAAQSNTAGAGANNSATGSIYIFVQMIEYEG